MKKLGVVLAVFLLVTTFSSFVSAQSVGDGFTRAAEFILGDFNLSGQVGEGEVFFIKLLIFIILIGIVGFAIGRIPGIGERTGVKVILTIAFSLISIRYVTSRELINFIWLPYGALGIAFSVIFPFVVAYFFIQSVDSSSFRKFGWSLLFVIFGALAILRWNDLAISGGSLFASLTTDFGSGQSNPPWYLNLGMVYVIAAVISVLLIFFDSQVRGMRRRSEFKDIEDAAQRRQTRHYARLLDEKYEELKHARGEHRRDIKSEIAQLKRSIRY